MAYDPADLRLPTWLLKLLDRLVGLTVPVGRNWRLAMTRPGIVFAAAWFGVWVAAFYSGNNLLYLCGAMLTAVMAAALYYGARLLREMPAISLPLLQAGDVSVIRQPLPGRADMAAVLSLSWSNPAGDFDLAARCTSEGSQLIGRLRPKRRGLFERQRLRLATAAPLGLFELSLSRDEASEMAVLPAPLPWQQDVQSMQQATNPQLFAREGDEWFDLRNYVPGDALSRIHWRKAAGDWQRWAVKRFHSPEAGREGLLLRVDLRLPAGRDSDDFDELLGRAWFWVRQARDAGGRLVLGQHYFDLIDEGQYRQALRALAAAVPESQPAADSGGLLLSLAET